MQNSRSRGVRSNTLAMHQPDMMWVGMCMAWLDGVSLSRNAEKVVLIARRTSVGNGSGRDRRVGRFTPRRFHLSVQRGVLLLQFVDRQVGCERVAGFVPGAEA